MKLDVRSKKKTAAKSDAKRNKDHESLTHERVTNWVMASAFALIALLAVATVISSLSGPVSLHTCAKVLVTLGQSFSEAVAACLASL